MVKRQSISNNEVQRAYKLFHVLFNKVKMNASKTVVKVKLKP
jgi:hypothetical protein